jgi:polyribonucleotide nucleotidyltransferase
MASVCGGSLAMMDAGVPTKCHVAGIAMGLISENEEVRVLSDILGTEDHLGDMDFKVAGTREGITAVQMDIKIKGLNFAVLEQALAQAKEGREHILEKMEETISEARPALSPYAPRITTLQIPVDKIGAVIGPGGKNIRSLIEETGTKIDIDDSGTVLIASTDGEMAEAAMRRIELMVKEPELNEVYEGKVTRLMDFGALVEILPGKEGMVHISELEHRRVENVTDIIKQGEMVKVKVIRLDRDGKIGLSRKALIPRPEGMPEEKPRQNDRRPPRRDGNRSSGPRRNPGKNE